MPSASRAQRKDSTALLRSGISILPMSLVGQSRRFGDVCDMSALPPTTAVLMQCRERQKDATTGLMHRSKFHPYSITLSVRANEQRPRPAFEGIVDTLPALQDLAPIWRSLLAVTSDVTHITII